jgi:hypothetical protein
MNKVHVNRFAVVNSIEVKAKKGRDQENKTRKDNISREAAQIKLDEGMFICSIQLILEYRPILCTGEIYEIFVGDYFVRKPNRNKVINCILHTHTLIHVIHTVTRTHTHTHIYIVCKRLCMCIYI